MWRWPSGTACSTTRPVRCSSSAAMWQLVKDRDAGAFATVPVPEIVIGTEVQSVPVEPDDQRRRAALPPRPPRARCRVPQPARHLGRDDRAGHAGRRPGRCGVVRRRRRRAAPARHGHDRRVRRSRRTGRRCCRSGWPWPTVPVRRTGIRPLACSPSPLPKGTTHVVPISSCCDAEDLKYLGVWSWLREYVEHLTVCRQHAVSRRTTSRRPARDRLAHVLQLADGGRPRPCSRHRTCSPWSVPSSSRSGTPASAA